MSGSEIHNIKRINRRILLVFSGLSLALLATTLLLASYILNLTTSRETERLSEIIAYTVKQAIERVAFSGKYHTRLLLQELQKEIPGYSYIAVIDNTGKILAHSQIKNLNQLNPEIATGKITFNKNEQTPIVRNIKTKTGRVREVLLPYAGGYNNQHTGFIQVGISTTESFRTARRGQYLIVAVSLLMLFITITINWYLSNLLGHPVKQLAQQMLGILQHSPMLIAIQNDKGDIIYSSRSFTQQFKNSTDNMQQIYSVLNENFQKQQQSDDQLVLNKKGSVKHIVEVPHKENIKYFLSLKFPVTTDKHDMVTHICSLYIDQTDQINAQKTIRQQHQELLQLNHKLQIKVNEVASLNDNLEVKIAKRTRSLEELNHELKTFNYSVSHDLRTPLRSIEGFIQIIIEDYSDRFNSEALNYFNRVRAASQRMERLIDDMLSLSRVSQQKLKSSRVNLSSLANEIIQQLQNDDPGREASITIDENMVVDGDEGLLRIMLENLLGNAWKYSHKENKTCVEFSKIQSDNEVQYFIRDNGVGFDMRYADKMYGPFQRLHKQGDFDGTGIGLATVKRILQRHGGRIWAESKPGEGAIFYFVLGAVDLSSIA